VATRREKRELLLVIEGKNNADVAVDSFADGMDKSTKKVKGFSTGLKSLDGQLKTTEKNISELRKEIHRTGDTELFKDLDKQIRRQQALLKKRKLLGPSDGEEAADGFFAGFSGRIGPLVTRLPLQPHMLAAIGGGAAAAAPFVAGIIGSAVSAGVGAAPIAIGLKLASQDSAVQAAAGGLGKELADNIGKPAAAAFHGPVIRSIAIVRAEARKLRPEINEIFDVSSTRLVPLTRSATAGMRELVLAIRDVNEDAGPVFDTLNEHIVKLSETGGQALRNLAGDAENSAAALDTALTLVEVSIAGTAGTIGLLNKAFPIVSGPLAIFGDLMGDSGDKADDASENIEDYANAIMVARQQSDKMISSLNELNGIQLSMNDAERAFQAAIDDAKEAFEGKVKVLDNGTERGREYSAALDNIAKTAESAAQATFDQTQSTYEANQVIYDGRDALYAQARAFGLSKRDAQAYVDSVLAIPKTWNTKVNADVAAARAALLDTKDILLSLRSRKLTVTVVQRMIKDNDYTGIARGYEEGGEIRNLPGLRGKDSGFIRAARGEYVLDTDTVDRAGGPRALDRWREMLKGTGYTARPMRNPYAARAGAAAAATAGGGTIPATVVGGAGAGFAALFHELLRTNAVQLVVGDGPLRGTRIRVG
jgi:hypothetical protein